MQVPTPQFWQFHGFVCPLCNCHHTLSHCVVTWSINWFCKYCYWAHVYSSNHSYVIQVSTWPLFSSLLACLVSPTSTIAQWTPTQSLHTFSMRILIGRWDATIVTSKVKETLPSLLDEPHPFNYSYILQAIEWKAETSACRKAKWTGESRYLCRCGRLLSGCYFGIKMVPEVISKHLNSKNFLGEHAP